MKDLRNELQRSRVEFGRMILRWRKRQGWAGQTWEDWARACPDLLPVPVLNSVITGLELGRGEKTAPTTFVGLGIANQALAQKDRGTIRDRVLHDRIYGAEPIRHEDGEPWDAADFFACFTGLLAVPTGLSSDAVELTSETSEEASEALRKRFRALTASSEMAPRQALDFMFKLQTRIPADSRRRLEEVLFGFGNLGPGDEETATLAELLLNRWSSQQNKG